MSVFWFFNKQLDLTKLSAEERDGLYHYISLAEKVGKGAGSSATDLLAQRQGSYQKAHNDITASIGDVHGYKSDSDLNSTFAQGAALTQQGKAAMDVAAIGLDKFGVTKPVAEEWGIVKKIGEGIYNATEGNTGKAGWKFSEALVEFLPDAIKKPLKIGMNEAEGGHALANGDYNSANDNFIDAYLGGKKELNKDQPFWGWLSDLKTGAKALVEFDEGGEKFDEASSEKQRLAQMADHVIQQGEIRADKMADRAEDLGNLKSLVEVGQNPELAAIKQSLAALDPAIEQRLTDRLGAGGIDNQANHYKNYINDQVSRIGGQAYSDTSGTTASGTVSDAEQRAEKGEQTADTANQQTQTEAQGSETAAQDGAVAEGQADHANQDTQQQADTSQHSEGQASKANSESQTQDGATQQHRADADQLAQTAEQSKVQSGDAAQQADENTANATQSAGDAHVAEDNSQQAATESDGNAQTTQTAADKAEQEHQNSVQSTAEVQDQADNAAHQRDTTHQSLDDANHNLDQTQHAEDEAAQHVASAQDHGHTAAQAQATASDNAGQSQTHLEQVEQAHTDSEQLAVEIGHAQQACGEACDNADSQRSQAEHHAGESEQALSQADVYVQDLLRVLEQSQDTVSAMQDNAREAEDLQKQILALQTETDHIREETQKALDEASQLATQVQELQSNAESSASAAEQEAARAEAAAARAEAVL